MFCDFPQKLKCVRLLAGFWNHLAINTFAWHFNFDWCLQVSRLLYARGSGNELLDFIKVQDPEQLKGLTESASAPVFEAMNSFVHRLIGTGGRKVEANHQELARIFYFLLVVGYHIRQLEVRISLLVLHFTWINHWLQITDTIFALYKPYHSPAQQAAHCQCDGNCSRLWSSSNLAA